MRAAQKPCLVIRDSCLVTPTEHFPVSTCVKADDVAFDFDESLPRTFQAFQRAAQRHEARDRAAPLCNQNGHAVGRYAVKHPKTLGLEPARGYRQFLHGLMTQMTM